MADDHTGSGGDYVEYVTAKAPWLRKIAYLLCQDWHRADDLTQTTIIKLYANWRRARNHANLDGYTRTILVNTFISEQRSHWWKHVTLVNPNAPGITGAMHERLGATPDRDPEPDPDLADALARIPPRQRAVIVLRYYCDLSVEDTATALRCSPGTVKSQTSRGLLALRARLGAVPEPETAGQLPAPTTPPSSRTGAAST